MATCLRVSPQEELAKAALPDQGRDQVGGGFVRQRVVTHVQTRQRIAAAHEADQRVHASGIQPGRLQRQTPQAREMLEVLDVRAEPERVEREVQSQAPPAGGLILGRRRLAV